MSSFQVQQLSTQQLKTRQLAQEYLKIQQNTEYLTHILRYSAHKLKVPVRPETIPDIKSLSVLTVQLAYLLFTCHIKSANIMISKTLLLKQPNRKDPTPEVYCEFLLQKEYSNMNEEQQKFVAKQFQKHEFSNLHPLSYGKYAIQYVNRLIEMVKPQLQKIKQPFDRTVPRYYVQFANLQPIIRNHIMPQLNKIQHPRVVILALQQSELFRQNSTLVKVMNNSLFSGIRNCKNKHIFEEICKLESRLISIRGPKQPLEVNCLKVEATIEEMLRFLIKNHIITVEQSIQEVGRNDQNAVNRPNPKMHQGTSKEYALGDIEGANTDRKYYCKIQVPQKAIRDFNAQVLVNIVFEALNNFSPSNQNTTQTGGSEIKPGGVKNQFLIQFMPLKGLLSVKYVTPIELNIENTDLVMYQCNNIAYHWSNVSMELIEKSTNKQVKRKERYLALKTMTHLHITDRPLFKFLLMMDLVMLCAKIAEPELKKNVVRGEDYCKVQEISLKIEHLIKLFIRKVETYYKAISESFADLNKKSS